MKWLLFVWELPQTIIALFLCIFYREKEQWKNPSTQVTVTKVSTTGSIFPVKNKNLFGTSGFSLGEFIFVPKSASTTMLKHETGHTRQSRILGPLYLLAVAIPSVITFAIYKTKSKSHEWYLSKYPECWAETLGATNKRSAKEIVDEKSQSSEEKP